MPTCGILVPREAFLSLDGWGTLVDFYCVWPLPLPSPFCNFLRFSAFCLRPLSTSNVSWLETQRISRPGRSWGSATWRLGAWRIRSRHIGGLWRFKTTAQVAPRGSDNSQYCCTNDIVGMCSQYKEGMIEKGGYV